MATRHRSPHACLHCGSYFSHATWHRMTAEQQEHHHSGACLVALQREAREPQAQPPMDWEGAPGPDSPGECWLPSSLYELVTPF